MTRQRQQSALTTNFKALPTEQAQTHGSDPTFLNSDDLNGHTGFLQNEFYRLLEESRLVAGVIEIHINNESRSFIENTSGTDPHRHHFDRNNGSEWRELVRTNLPHWLFWLTYILTAQAKLAAEDRPMSRRQLVQLLNDRLFQAGDELGLKERRKRIWTPDILRKAVHCGLKDINTPGAVTLENVARRITLRANNSLPIALKRPLSGKHLQKLLRQNDIDWIEIKRSYKDRILTRFRKC